MPLKQYGVLKGKAVAAKREDGQDTPHYQVQIEAGNTDYRIAVNVKSQESPSDLLYLVDQNFHHPITSRLPALKDGFAKLEKQPGGIGLDFVRANLFNRLDMKKLPSSLPGPNNDLSDLLELYVKRSVTRPQPSMFLGNAGGRSPDKRTRSSDFVQATASMTSTLIRATPPTSGRTTVSGRMGV